MEIKLRHLDWYIWYDGLGRHHQSFNIGTWVFSMKTLMCGLFLEIDHLHSNIGQIYYVIILYRFRSVKEQNVCQVQCCTIVERNMSMCSVVLVDRVNYIGSLWTTNPFWSVFCIHMLHLKSDEWAYCCPGCFPGNKYVQDVPLKLGLCLAWLIDYLLVLKK